ncbi:MAG TPA: superoxide dismutase [Spirochaetota bacterium]|jgi:Fe-Mn family superoxide dismutase|nr:MAG: Superoxide dismutase (Fe) [Spirochaetes bacterium ADurb.Bin218]HOK02921.1 superoxide dismutase [Spirochaetota bacterium]HOK93415.1 superoxide dismutase [Spirochaetota bacterium]HON16216.1 superoxide dismutase [Spirochaetota bacterium]HOV08698.1 superoxide dismutase [Spirochaetota bacterium]
MAIVLPDLPYSKDDLAPYISANTLDFHHGKHHNAYVTNLNKLIAGTDMENLSLEDIIIKSAKDPAMTGIFNNGAQVWNHTFYWNCMKKNGGGKPSGKLAEAIDKNFGSFEKFIEEIKNAAVTQFGSGWAWLVKDGDSLKVMKTSNADTPLAHGLKALLTIDVWEHAYYLDYQNRRPDYVSAFFENLVNWDFVASNL